MLVAQVEEQKKMLAWVPMKDLYKVKIKRKFCRHQGAEDKAESA